MRPRNWTFIFVLCALLGIAAGYIVTMIYRPQLIPPVLRIGGITRPATLLLLGVDIVYTKERRHLKADPKAFNGRSDTIMLVRLDPITNSFTILSIPRDTSVDIPGHGKQKINGANALGGPRLAAQTVSGLTGVPVDYFLVLNVHGLVDLVDELGGITVNIPKKMKYRDRAAKLSIDLSPGPHLLNGTESMGFVRFRHDALGDIGRVQRQELFIHAVLDKAVQPQSWAKVPKLVEIAFEHVQTNMSTPDMFKMLNFLAHVPKTNQHMVMLPGNFSGTGDWAVDYDALRRVVMRMLGQTMVALPRTELKIAVEDGSGNFRLARKVSKYLSNLGYNVVITKDKSELFGELVPETKIVASKANVEDAAQLKKDLRGQGKVVSASLGDIQADLTLVIGPELAFLGQSDDTISGERKKRRRH